MEPNSFDRLMQSVGSVADATQPYAAAATYALWGAALVVGAALIGAAAFMLPRAGQAIARNYPHVAEILKIHSAPKRHVRHVSTYLGTPAE